MSGASGSEISQAQQWVKAFCTERAWDQFHGPKDLAIGLATESAELLELFRFQSEKQSRVSFKKPEFREKVSDELADVFFFLLRFSERHNIDLMQALETKMKKNAQKYPIESAKGRNLKYTELTEGK